MANFGILFETTEGCAPISFSQQAKILFIYKANTKPIYYVQYHTKKMSHARKDGLANNLIRN